MYTYQEINLTFVYSDSYRKLCENIHWYVLKDIQYSTLQAAEFYLISEYVSQKIEDCKLKIITQSIKKKEQKLKLFNLIKNLILNSQSSL